MGRGLDHGMPRIIHFEIPPCLPAVYCALDIKFCRFHLSSGLSAGPLPLLACVQWVSRPPELSKPVLNYCALLQLRICALWWSLQCLAGPGCLRVRHGEASPVKCRSRSHISSDPRGISSCLIVLALILAPSFSPCTPHISIKTKTGRRRRTPFGRCARSFSQAA